MAINKILNNLPDIIKKHKFTLLILLLGLIFMTLPKINNIEEINESITSGEIKLSTLEDRMEDFLKDIEGVGSVSVILTVSQGEETFYQTDDTVSKDNDTFKEDKNTVTITDANRNQSGLVRQKNPPEYLGAIVAFQGADDPVLKYIITDAVAKITGLKTNQISVLKLK